MPVVQYANISLKQLSVNDIGTQGTQCVSIEQASYINLGKHSWIIIIPTAISCDQQEFTSLWQLHPPEPDTIRVFGKQHKIPRYQRLYGENCTYTFSGKTMPAYPIDHSLIQRACQHANTCEPTINYNGILVNWYESGLHSMGLHADDEPELHAAAPIFSYSFGAQRLFRIRPISSDTFIKSRLDILLSHRMLLIMGGAMQSNFKHELPKSRRVLMPRINFTVRAFKNKGHSD